MEQNLKVVHGGLDKRGNCLMNGIKAKTLVFATMKGGSGKTTLSYNLACMLAEKSKVLCIDIDPQCNLSSNFCVDIWDENLMSVADIFENGEVDPLNVTIFSPLPQLETLDLIPSTIYLYGTELNLVMKSMREQILTSYMMFHKEFFNFYDYIIIDTPPNFGICTQNCLLVADHVILVTDPDCNSPRGADIFINHWNATRQRAGKEDNVDGFIINNVERTRISSNTIKYINDHPILSKIKFKTTIPHTTRFKECGDQNLPITLLKTEKKNEEVSRQKAETVLRSLLDEMKERGIV